jgi:acetyl-CoA carboxylase carboxyl transferase subunit beta
VNWIENVVRPRIRGLLAKRDTPENLWVKCPDTGEMVFHKDLEANQFVFPDSGFHQRINARTRLRYVFDDEKWQPIELPQVPVDPLKFRDERRYSERLKAAKAKTGMEDAVLAGTGTIKGVAAVVAVQDFDFMGGSLGMAAAEAIITAAEAAVRQEKPFVLFAGSGGARMQEGILSLMQLPRTTVAVDWLKEASLPYLVVLTNPTTGGVTASYAMLGDVHIAEPGALIGFAGPRVIEQTIREKLPDGFQRSEYLVEHGMVDMVVARQDLPATIARLLRLFMKLPAGDGAGEGMNSEDGASVAGDTDETVADGEPAAVGDGVTAEDGVAADMPDLFDDAPEPESEAAPESKGADTADGESAADAPTSEKPDS